DASCPCRLQRSGARRDLHSFPTRRSSDLNPWPSSDWAAFVSERGFPAALLLAFALIGIGARAMRRLVGAGDADEALGAAVLLARSEEHTSELQSRENLVCRLLLEKKKRQH